MNCTNCGNKLEEGVKFCGKCGTPTKVESTPKKEKFLSVIAVKRVASPANHTKLSWLARLSIWA